MEKENKNTMFFRIHYKDGSYVDLPERFTNGKDILKYLTDLKDNRLINDDVTIEGIFDEQKLELTELEEGFILYARDHGGVCEYISKYIKKEYLRGYEDGRLGLKGDNKEQSNSLESVTLEAHKRWVEEYNFKK